MKVKLLDALVPLFPEFQTHLQSENSRPQERHSFELYGPLWIFITMVIEFLILGHFDKLLLSGNNDEMFSGVPKKYGFFSADTLNANQSLHKIATMSFLLAVFFLGVPLAQYMTLRS